MVKNISLFERLKASRSEEDLKATYIERLGLHSVSMNLVDIQTENIWFEAKLGSNLSIYQMFAQLFWYVRDAYDHGRRVPPFLCVIDSVKVGLIKTSDVLPWLSMDASAFWTRSAASSVPKDLVKTVSNLIGTLVVSFKVETQEAELVRTITEASKTNKIVRTKIVPSNIKRVFDEWVSLVGREIEGATEDQWATFFYADIMSDGTKPVNRKLPARVVFMQEPVFRLNRVDYALLNSDGYHQFWSIYDRPPESAHRSALLERRDALIPVNERVFKGAFYTPLQLVRAAYGQIENVLGQSWQEEYVVWDMCCGVGNLEVSHSFPERVFMSTLDQADLDVMRGNQVCGRATIFQYDYLNDDVSDFSEIDYTLSNKMPKELRVILENSKKIKGRSKPKVLILINPPYAEATNFGVTSKKKVASNRFESIMMDGMGKSKNELATQFLARIQREIPNAVVAVFSKLKYINAENYEDFRKLWGGEFLGGFVAPSKAFDGLKGDFPIGFAMWKLRGGSMTQSEFDFSVLDRDGTYIGQKKFFRHDKGDLLSKWIERPRANDQVALPLSNSVTPATNAYLSSWSDEAIGYLSCAGNDFQQASRLTALYSSVFGNGHGLYVTQNNLLQVAAVFAARRCFPHTWLNDRDQFMSPSETLSQEFLIDCLVWMLFNGSNLSAGAKSISWSGKNWALVNNFIPFKARDLAKTVVLQSEITANIIHSSKPSREAKEVLKVGLDIWNQYHKAPAFPHSVRTKLSLGTDDVGWYQIRTALSERDSSLLDALTLPYWALTEKVRAGVIAAGFIR